MIEIKGTQQDSRLSSIYIITGMTTSVSRKDGKLEWGCDIDKYLDGIIKKLIVDENSELLVIVNFNIEEIRIMNDLKSIRRKT